MLTKLRRNPLKNKLCFIGLTLTCLVIAYSVIPNDKSLLIAPDVKFTTITGKTINLQALQGNPVIITFWATDCAACMQEIPHLRKLHQQYHDQGLHIIAVNMYYDIPSHVVAMTKAKKLPYDVALDIRNQHAEAFGNIQLIPSTLLIANDGMIDQQITGLFDPQKMAERIQYFLQG